MSEDAIYHTRGCDKTEPNHFYQIRPYYEGSERLAIVLYCPECGGYREFDADPSFRSLGEQRLYERYVETSCDEEE